MARTAVVSFEGDADRRIAGVPWAARVARELAEAGYERVVLPPLRTQTLREIERLAPRLKVDLSGDGEAVSARLPSEVAILRGTGKPGDGPVSRRINRPVSRALSRMVLRIPGIRPSHATLFNAAIALLMFWALTTPSGLVMGALLFQAASVLDGVDGEIARATFRASRSGAMLDSIVDVATTLLFITGLMIHLSSRGHDEALLLAGWGLALFLLGLSVILWHGSRTHGPFNFNHIKRHYRERTKGRFLPHLIRALTIFASRDFFALFLASLVVAGVPIAALYVFAAAATIWILFVLGSLGRGAAAAASDFLSKA